MTKVGEMTHLERLTAVLNKETPDMVPIGWEVWNPASQLKPQDWLKLGRDGKKIAKIKLWQHERFNIDYNYPQVTLYQTLEAWGLKLKFTDKGHPIAAFSVNPDKSWIKNKPHLDSFDGEKYAEFVDNLEVPDPYTSPTTRSLIKAVEIMSKSDMVVGAYGLDAPTEAYFLTSTHAQPTLMYKSPKTYLKLVQKCLEFGNELMKAQLDAGAQFVAYGAAPTGLSCHNQNLVRFDFEMACYFLRLHQMFAKKHGAIGIATHACRNSIYFMQHLKEFALRTGYHAISLSDYADAIAAKKAAGRKIVVATGPDPTTMMRYGTPKEIERAVKYYLSDGNPMYMLHVRDGMPNDTPLKNVDAFVKAGRKWGKYPIPEEFELIDTFNL